MGRRRSRHALSPAITRVQSTPCDSATTVRHSRCCVPGWWLLGGGRCSAAGKPRASRMPARARVPSGRVKKISVAATSRWVVSASGSHAKP